MNDFLSEYRMNDRLKYTEKQLGKEILEYNRRFSNEYPVIPYVPRKKAYHEFTAGFSTPLADMVDMDLHIRLTYYRHKYIMETSRNWSVFRGISYKYIQGPSALAAGAQYDYSKSWDHYISIVPAGIRYQTDWKNINPYFYLGAALNGIIETSRQYDNTSQADIKNAIIPFIFANPGAGGLIKTGSLYLKLEVTPTLGDGWFFNLGLSIP